MIPFPFAALSYFLTKENGGRIKHRTTKYERGSNELSHEKAIVIKSFIGSLLIYFLFEMELRVASSVIAYLFIIVYLLSLSIMTYILSYRDSFIVASYSELR